MTEMDLPELPECNGVQRSNNTHNYKTHTYICETFLESIIMNCRNASWILFYFLTLNVSAVIIHKKRMIKQQVKKKRKDSSVSIDMPSQDC